MQLHISVVQKHATYAYQKKLQIFQADLKKFLNKCSELVSKCQHRRKKQLQSFNQDCS